jgi:hypothetical protein
MGGHKARGCKIIFWEGMFFQAGMNPAITIICKKTKTDVGAGFIPPEKFVVEGFIPSRKNKKWKKFIAEEVFLRDN